MNTASINDHNINRKLQTSIWDKLAKKMLFKVLADLEVGRLVINFGGEVYSFGQSVDQASIVGHLFIHHSSAYRDLAMGGSIGSGEAYMLGSWSSSNLVDVIRLFAANIELLNKMDDGRPLLTRMTTKIAHFLNANSQSGSRKNIAAHYDLGNNFFDLFLDPTMMYSAAIFPHKESGLEEASIYKLDTVCKKLKLNQSDHLLDIGTGWGGLAIHAAKKYGCRVTTTTISREQYEYAKAAVVEAGVEDKVTLLLEDYRDLTGSYDKLVSIEMIEAVGHEFYDSYFEKCSSLLMPDGLMVIQAITIADKRYDYAKNSVDFIQRYIFPGGGLPSNEVIAGCIRKNTDMLIVGVEDIGLHYARTLAEWRKRFHDRRNEVKQQGFDDVFCRMWDFYLCYCEGGFTERAISTVQVVFAKPAARDFEPLRAL